MTGIIDRYVVREVLRTCAGVTPVLLIILVIIMILVLIASAFGSGG